MKPLPRTEEIRRIVQDSWGGILWDEKGNRILPTIRELDRRSKMVHGSVWDTLFMATDQDYGTLMFFIPTVEWVAMFVRIARRMKFGLVLEVGSGDGFTTQCLQRAAPEITWVATDDGSWSDNIGRYSIHPPQWVDIIDCNDAVEKYKPDLVFWCWPPYTSQDPDRVILNPLVRYYIEMGELAGGCTGCDSTKWRFNNKVLRKLTMVARGRSDDFLTRSACIAFYGAGHPKFYDRGHG